MVNLLIHQCVNVTEMILFTELLHLCSTETVYSSDHVTFLIKTDQYKLRARRTEPSCGFAYRAAGVGS